MGKHHVHGMATWVQHHMSHPMQHRMQTQRLHRIEVWITRSADGKTGKAFVGDMTEEKSIEMASKLVSEGFVFTVSAHAPKPC